MAQFEELIALEPRSNFCSVRLRKFEAPTTPHKISVLLLVQEFMTAKSAATFTRINFPNQKRRNFCLLLLKLIQFPDMSYNDLHNLLTSPRYEINEAHIKGFEKAITNLYTNGIEALFDFANFQNADRRILENWGISQHSIVGLYIRRVVIILERLSFPEMMALYKNICLYYQKGIQALSDNKTKTLNPLIIGKKGTTSNSRFIGESIGDESILDTNTVHQDRNPHSKWSPKQADLFVFQQCNLLENNELRALPPNDLQSKLNEIIQDNPLNSQAYFLGYMNQLRIRDFFGASNWLHRAFDRSPVQMMNQYEQKGFQYFSVNLSVLHANFDHRKEALNALKECIMISQECGDKNCLDLANSWYCLLNSNRIDPFEKNLPDLQDPGLIQSLSLAIQYVVKFGAQCGYLPIDLFDLLVQCDELNSKNSTLEHFADSLALRSALWCLYGRYELSSMYSQLLMHLKKSWTFGDVGNSESVSKVLASLALWLSLQGESHLSSVVLNHARERFLRFPYASNWMISQCYITIQESLHKFCWQAAGKSCCQLFLLDPIAGKTQRATIYIAKRSFEVARQILDDLLIIDNLDILTKVRVYILLAYISLSQNLVTAQTVDLIVKASVLAAKSYLEYEHSISGMLLAKTLLLMGLPQKALQAITNFIDRIHTNGCTYDRAKANFVFAQCLIATSKDATDKREKLRKVLKTLKISVLMFRKLEAHAKVLDVFAFIAISFNELNDEQERNKYSFKFRRYYNDHPVSREYLGMLF